MRWFGKSWGAPCCEPEEHAHTPVRASCMFCGEMIKVGDQGFAMPLVHADQSVTVEAAHRHCYERRIFPHDRECPHCRGKRPEEHAPRCASHQGENCNCIDLRDL